MRPIAPAEVGGEWRFEWGKHGAERNGIPNNPQCDQSGRHDRGGHSPSDFVIGSKNVAETHHSRLGTGSSETPKIHAAQKVTLCGYSQRRLCVTHDRFLDVAHTRNVRKLSQPQTETSPVRRTKTKRAAACLLFVAAFGSASALSPPSAEASDTIYISCDYAAHVCLQVVRLDDGTRVGTKYGYDNFGNYWQIETGLVS